MARGVCVGIVVVVCWLACQPAQGVAAFSLWFADAAGNDPGDTLRVEPGGAFDVRVYASQNLPAGKQGYLLMAAIGIDRSSAKGSSAAAMDRKIVPAQDNLDLDVIWGPSWTADYPNDPKKALEGFEGVGVRPWGISLMREDLEWDAANFSGRLLATLHLKNNLQAGQSYNMTIWDAGFGDAGTSLLMDSSGISYRAATDTLRILATPEPTSLLFSLVLAGICRRSLAIRVCS